MKTQPGPILLSLVAASLAATLHAPAGAQSFSDEEVLIEPILNVAYALPMDVDGDGRIDILQAGSGPRTLGWLRNDPERGYVQEAPILVGESIRSMTTADVDLDGDLDIVLGGENAEALSWLANLGGGAFSGRQPILSGPFSVREVQAGDFDGDGDSDFAMLLVVPGAGSRISWVENASVSGLGIAFGQRQLLSIAQGRYTGMAVGDVDGDGDDDVLGADETAPAIVMHENVSPGSFGASTILSSSVSRPASLAIGDVDGDGTADVMAVEQFNARMYWLRGLGSGTFAAPTFGFSTAGDIYAFGASDLNGDGAVECFARRSFSSPDLGDEYYLFPNTGGVFGNRVLLGTTGNGGGPNEFVFADADLDGDVDVVALSYRRTSLHLNDGSSIGEGISLLVDIENAPGVRAADLDEDGNADLLVALGPNDGGLFGWIKNRGGAFGGLTQELPINTARQVSAVDLDQDGDLDLVSGGGSYETVQAVVRWAENLGQGQFADPATIYMALADSGATFSTGDMEADGDLDFLVAHREAFSFDLFYTWVTNGPTGFTNGPGVAASRLGHTVRLADLDGDGASDIGFVHAGDGAVYWLKNTGTGAMGSQGQVTPLGMSLSSYEFGDVDLDGDVDVIVVGDNGTALALNDGLGVFAAPVPLDSSDAYFVHVRDLNSDGLPDAIVNRPSAPARWMRNLGGGAFGPAEDLPGGDSFVYDVGDLDGDLDIDILRRAQDGSITINLNEDRFGVGFCGPSALHSGGLSAVITASGSPSVASNTVQLQVERLPTATFGFFLIADAPGFVAGPGGSQGNLCLGGAIGRLLLAPGAIFMTGPSGAAQVDLDLTRVPTPSGMVALSPGDTRFAQAWFRDSNPMATSNFTNGLLLEFE